jgi:hypothetical protein
MRVLVLREPVTLNRSLGSKSTVHGGGGEGSESTYQSMACRRSSATGFCRYSVSRELLHGAQTVP